MRVVNQDMGLTAWPLLMCETTPFSGSAVAEPPVLPIPLLQDEDEELEDDEFADDDEFDDEDDDKEFDEDEVDEEDVDDLDDDLDDLEDEFEDEEDDDEEEEDDDVGGFVDIDVGDDEEEF